MRLVRRPTLSTVSVASSSSSIAPAPASTSAHDDLMADFDDDEEEQEDEAARGSKKVILMLLAVAPYLMAGLCSANQRWRMTSRIERRLGRQVGCLGLQEYRQ